MDLLKVLGSRTKAAASHFSSVAPTVWNDLPLAIRNSCSIGTFKSHLKTHLFHCYLLAKYYSTHLTRYLSCLFIQTGM